MLFIRKGFKMSLSGSPRGTIRIYPSPSEDKELQEESQNEDVKKDRNRLADAIYNKNLHPYIDTCKRDDSKHIFLVFPEKVENRNIDGHYFVILDDLGIKEEPIFDFWGSTIDFVYALIHEIPSVSQVIINNCDNRFPMGVMKVLQNELCKHAIELFSASEIEYSSQNVDEKEVTKNISVQDLAKAVEDPTMRSMLQDPFHKTRGQKLSSKNERLLKIAYHIIRTPVDEIESDDDRWSIVPDKPSEENEKEAIEKFPTRDKAALRLKEIEEKNVDEEKITASEILQANVMNDWVTPEEAQKIAWSLRGK